MRYGVAIRDRNGMPLGTCVYELEHRVPEGGCQLQWSIRVVEVDGFPLPPETWCSFPGSASDALTAFHEQLLSRYRPGSTLVPTVASE